MSGDSVNCCIETVVHSSDSEWCWTLKKLQALHCSAAGINLHQRHFEVKCCCLVYKVSKAGREDEQICEQAHFAAEYEAK